MNGNVKIALVAGGSFIAGILAARTQLVRKYEEILENELEEARLVHMEELADFKRKMREKLEDFDNQSVVQQIVETEAARMVPSQTEHKPHDYTQYHTKSGTVVAPAATMLATVDPNAPVIIGETRFLESEHTYVLTYYQGDDVVTDQDENPVDKTNRERMLAQLDGHLHEYVNDEGNVFVWNPTLNRAFQVIINKGKYTEEVLGQ